MNNLLDYNLEELTQITLNLNQPKFRAKQLYNAILNGKNFGDNTVLPQQFLLDLTNANYQMQAVKIYKTVTSHDKSVKFLFKLNDNNLIEGVLMKHSYGNTLCVSTQVGCKMNCAFCASGLSFVKNLTAGEILGQVVAVNTWLGGSVTDRKLTNLVLMGSGEPLDNFDNVVKFLKLVTDDGGFNFSVRNITLSTCGIPSKIEKLADTGLNINLAISLHAPNDEIRKQIMPVAKSFSIESVLESAKYYTTITNRKIYIEYALISGVNSETKHARELAELLAELNPKVNLIPLNEVKERGLYGVSEAKTNAFLRELKKFGISATVRKSLGDDVDGACGQLRNKELKQNSTKIVEKQKNSTTLQTSKNASNKAKNTGFNENKNKNYAKNKLNQKNNKSFLAKSNKTSKSLNKNSSQNKTKNTNKNVTKSSRSKKSF